MGELVDELERLGYVRREPDRTDRRAKIVVPTEKALSVIDRVRRVNRTIEHGYRQLLGEETYATLRAALLAIVPPLRALVQPRITGNGRRRSRSATR